MRKIEKYMKNSNIFRYVLMCGIQRKGMMTKEIKVEFSSVGKRSEEEGSFTKGPMGSQCTKMFFFLNQIKNTWYQLITVIDILYLYYTYHFVC